WISSSGVSMISPVSGSLARYRSRRTVSACGLGQQADCCWMDILPPVVVNKSCSIGGITESAVSRQGWSSDRGAVHRRRTESPITGLPHKQLLCAYYGVAPSDETTDEARHAGAVTVGVLRGGETTGR